MTSLAILSSEKLHLICFSSSPASFLLVIDDPISCFHPLMKGIPQYFGPLEVNTDIGVLAGHSLLITEKDNVQKKSGHYVLKKAASVGYRSNAASRLFTSASTDESEVNNESTKTTKQTKQRWSLQLFGVKVIQFEGRHSLGGIQFQSKSKDCLPSTNAS